MVCIFYREKTWGLSSLVDWRRYLDPLDGVPTVLTLWGSSCPRPRPGCSWSVSFYPQVLLNFRRKTSVGLSFDFLLYNVLAFSCYAAFTGEPDCLAGEITSW